MSTSRGYIGLIWNENVYKSIRKSITTPLKQYLFGVLIPRLYTNFLPNTIYTINIFKISIYIFRLVSNLSNMITTSVVSCYSWQNLKMFHATRTIIHIKVIYGKCPNIFKSLYHNGKKNPKFNEVERSLWNR